MTNQRREFVSAFVTAAAILSLIFIAGASHLNRAAASPQPAPFQQSEPAVSSRTPAGSHCDQIVVDRQNLLNDEIVERAAQPLIDFGANPRVVTIDSDEGSDLRGTVIELARQCPTWVNIDGGAASRTVILAVDIPGRRTEILFGVEYDDELADFETIMSDDMNPRFADGNFTDGMVDGLAAVHENITNPGAPVDLGSRLAGEEARAAQEEARQAQRTADLIAVVRSDMLHLGSLAATVLSVRYAAGRWISRRRERAEKQDRADLLRASFTDAQTSLFQFDQTRSTIASEVVMRIPSASTHERSSQAQKRLDRSQQQLAEYSEALLNQRTIVEALSSGSSEEFISNAERLNSNLVSLQKSLEDDLGWLADFNDTERETQRQRRDDYKHVETRLDEISERLTDLAGDDNYDLNEHTERLHGLSELFDKAHTGNDFLSAETQSMIKKAREETDDLASDIEETITSRREVLRWLETFEPRTGYADLVEQRQRSHRELVAEFGPLVEPFERFLNTASERTVRSDQRVRSFAEGKRWRRASLEIQFGDENTAAIPDLVAKYDDAATEYRQKAETAGPWADEIVAQATSGLEQASAVGLFEKETSKQLLSVIGDVGSTMADTLNVEYPDWEAVHKALRRNQKLADKTLSEWQEQVDHHRNLIAEYQSKAKELDRRKSTSGAFGATIPDIPTDARPEDIIWIESLIRDAETAIETQERENRIEDSVSWSSSSSSSSSSSGGGSDWGGGGFGGGGGGFGGGGSDW